MIKTLRVFRSPQLGWKSFCQSRQTSPFPNPSPPSNKPSLDCLKYFEDVKKYGVMFINFFLSSPTVKSWNFSEPVH